MENVGRHLKRAAAVLMAVCIFTMNVFPAQAGKEEEKSTNLQLYAKSAVLMDADSGRILFGKNENEILPMASTTKIMTCILALEYGNTEDYVPVSAYASRMPKVRLGVQEGEYYRLGDLLYSLMLESHNDAAAVIAEHIGGSAEGFAKLMNQKARDIGCYDSFFITPNGLDASAEGGKVHSTTAADLARIMSYCITDSPKKEEFLRITRTQSYTFHNYRMAEGEAVSYTDGGRTFSCVNHNAFLTMMEGALSGKTGFTNNAGYCYVGALTRDGKTFVVALLACGWPNHKTYKWTDTRELMEYGLENYEYRDVYQPAEFKDIAVEAGVPANQRPFGRATLSVGVPEDTEGSLNLLLREDETVERKVELPEKLEAPVKQGDVVGYVKYYLDNTLIRQDPVTARMDVETLNFTWMFRYIANLFLL